MADRTRPLEGELLRIRDEIYSYAIEFGLDFHPVRFEVCDYDTINILAAQGGFPSRYPHWRFGMDYDQLSKGYAYGLQKNLRDGYQYQSLLRLSVKREPYR